MTTVLLVVHLFVTLALIGLVLLQRSEGGGLGIGSSQGMGAFMTGRGTANLLTRATAVLEGMGSVSRSVAIGINSNATLPLTISPQVSETVTVTAQKVTQDLQKTAAAVTALSGEALVSAGAHDIRATEASALLITLSAVGDDFLPELSESGGA